MTHHHQVDLKRLFQLEWTNFYRRWQLQPEVDWLMDLHQIYLTAKRCKMRQDLGVILTHSKIRVTCRNYWYKERKSDTWRLQREIFTWRHWLRVNLMILWGVKLNSHLLCWTKEITAFNHRRLIWQLWKHLSLKLLLLQSEIVLWRNRAKERVS